MATKRSFGEMLIGALDEAVAHSRGELTARVDRRDVVTARSVSVSPPPKYTAGMIRDLRKELGVSQPVFAGMLNVSGSTVRAWEQGAREPDGPSLRLLEVAEKHPDVLLADVAPRASAS